MFVAFMFALNVVWLANAMPLAKRMVDMTYVFDETTQHFPNHKEFEIIVTKNGTIEGTDIWVQVEEYSSAIHVGTHMDAPAHFSKGGRTIEEIPISKFIAPAAVIDITHRANLDPSAEVTVDDLINWEATTGQSLNGTIVLMRSGWGLKWNNRTAFYGTPIRDDPSKLKFPGIGPVAAQWLVHNRSINGVGVDTLSFDRGGQTGANTHRILLGNDLFGLENVANMEELPIYGAKLYVFPMKIGRGSGAPTRVIATFPEIIYNIQSLK